MLISGRCLAGQRRKVAHTGVRHGRDEEAGWAWVETATSMWSCSGPLDLSDDWCPATPSVTHLTGCISASQRELSPAESGAGAIGCGRFDLAVGPRGFDGLALVEACATAGTHHADLAGELRFLRKHRPA
jgi:hypothetical protein